MPGICLLVAGVVVASIPADEFTLAWQHSVEKTRWEERYRVAGSRLALVEAGVAGMGAGMEPPEGARLAHGRWLWKPRIAPLPELKLTRSAFAHDYDVCWRGHCQTLAALTGSPSTAVITVRACAKR